MSKRIALKDYIEVDGVDISNFCSQVQSASDHAQEDVSGFNLTGSDEFLAGKTTQSVTLQCWGSYGAGEIHQTLMPLHRDKLIAPFVWRPDGSNAVSATNPELRGNIQILNYGPGATRGSADSFSVTLSTADETGLVWYET